MTERQRRIILYSALLLLCFHHFRVVNLGEMDFILEHHQALVTRTEVEPYRFRVLIPYTAEGLASILPMTRPYGLAVSYWIIGSGSLGAFVILLYRFLRRPRFHFPPDQVLIACLLACLSFVVVFANATTIPNTWVEADLLLLGLLCCERIFSSVSSSSSPA